MKSQLSSKRAAGPFRGVVRIISGGQTGADRAALDAAMALGIPHGGFVPAGRRAEDGPIPDIYKVAELESPDYDLRTERNIVESDATLIVSFGPLTGGSLTTRRMTKRHDKPLLHVDLSRIPPEVAVEQVTAWLADFGPRVLNVAGPRESTTPGIYEITRALLMAVFAAN